ncbi:MAG: alkaline phosphatase PhoX [Pseudomonadota bacterium]|uniref:PhoX family protein n=1 Tax=Thermithiobacillus tepidarius TaxID=929 RepID=UPI00041668E8|nr:alkaline phosphatase PhoX [Thermithiobacillus tepidarius]
MNFTLKHLPVALAMAGVISLSACVSDGSDTTATTSSQSALTRLATTAAGAEFTGLYLTETGDLFFNVQHPDAGNAFPYNHGSVGVIAGTDFNQLPTSFAAVSVPASTAEKMMVRTAVGSYQIIARGGDTLGGLVPAGLGTVLAADGTPITQSDDPDMNTFVPIAGTTGEGYLFTNWEDRPGNMSRLRIKKNANGVWSVTEAMNVDFKSVQGTWVNCFGTLSPWGNPLTSEELYFDDTSKWSSADKGVANLQKYLGKFPNPYRYGYIVEITSPAATPTPVKHFAMGRFSHENSVVMPDNKTAYLSDDGDGTVFFKFVANTANDLSSGTLYAAKVTQDAGVTDPAKAGFNIEWVEIGKSDDTTIATWIAAYDGDGVNPASYITDADINAWAEKKLNKDLNGNGTIESPLHADDRYAFLESRKAAKALGATAEFKKMEGVNINYNAAKDGSVPYAYMAMSDVSGTMADGTGAINVDANKCGVVYRMKLDTTFNISRMEPAIAGGPYDKTLAENQCAVDNISNPDNILVMKDGRVIVGEDTGYHANNMLWVFNSTNK